MTLAKDSTPPGEVPTDPQWERAHQAWALVVDIEADRLDAAQRKALIRVLRVKRSEREALFARLPGAVRRGARIDLESAHEALREQEIPVRLERRSKDRSPDPEP